MTEVYVLFEYYKDDTRETLRGIFETLDKAMEWRYNDLPTSDIVWKQKNGVIQGQTNSRFPRFFTIESWKVQ